MTTTFYDHWRDVPEKAWRWTNFSPAEIACRSTGKLLVNEPTLDKLQALRDRLGKPLIVRSAYRSPEHNRAVGGATRSKHMNGAALDIAMSNHEPVAFEAAARAVGFLGFGFYPRSGFMHVDLGPARQWGERYPIRATAFAEDAPPARGAGREPHDERRGIDRSRNTRRSRGRGHAERPGGDPIRDPAACAISRHASLGLHRRGARWHCGHDLRSPR
nr:D-Ala-D-Ala carboxypeptidase family metallohydrolase [Palleronia caenipelagi]